MIKAFFLIIVMFVLSTPFVNAKDIRVVTTLAVFEDLVRRIGGDKVNVHNLTPGTQDAHFYEPKPSDIVKLSKADIFAHAGLDLELWRGPLVEASRNRKVLPGAEGDLDLSQGVKLLEVPTYTPSRAAGDIHIFGNPHYWLDPENGKIIARNIYKKLSSVSPEYETRFRQNLENFNVELDQKIKEWTERLAPYRGFDVTAYHNTWPYFAQRFGLKIDLFLEPKPGIPPSGSHIAEVIGKMKERGVKVIIIEPFYPKRYAESVARQTGALVLDFPQIPGALGVDGYFELFDYLIAKLKEAFETAAGGGGNKT